MKIPKVLDQLEECCFGLTKERARDCTRHGSNGFPPNAPACLTQPD